MLEQFQEVFANDLPGCTQDPVHTDLKNEAQPVFLKSRAVPFALRDDVVVKGFRVGGSVCARNFAAGPRWKRAEVIKVKGPVSYIVRMANGDVHHRHRNQLRRAWTAERPSEPDYHFRIPLVRAPVDMEPGVDSPSPLHTPEEPQLRRSTRSRRKVVRFDSTV